VSSFRNGPRGKQYPIREKNIIEQREVKNIIMRTDISLSKATSFFTNFLILVREYIITQAE